MNSGSRVREIVARALGRPVTEILADARMGETDGWDSLGHMRILLEAERTLGRQFDPETAVSIVDLQSLERALVA
jgi:acyl carrier protein